MWRKTKEEGRDKKEEGRRKKRGGGRERSEMEGCGERQRRKGETGSEEGREGRMVRCQGVPELSLPDLSFPGERNEGERDRRQK